MATSIQSPLFPCQYLRILLYVLFFNCCIRGIFNSFSLLAVFMCSPISKELIMYSLLYCTYIWWAPCRSMYCSGGPASPRLRIYHIFLFQHSLQPLNSAVVTHPKCYLCPKVLNSSDFAEAYVSKLIIAPIHACIYVHSSCFFHFFSFFSWLHPRIFWHILLLLWIHQCVLQTFPYMYLSFMHSLVSSLQYFYYYFFFTAHRGFIKLFIQYYSVICRPSDYGEAPPGRDSNPGRAI